MVSMLGRKSGTQHARCPVRSEGSTGGGFQVPESMGTGLAFPQHHILKASSNRRQGHVWTMHSGAEGRVGVGEALGVGGAWARPRPFLQRPASSVQPLGFADPRRASQPCSALRSPGRGSQWSFVRGCWKDRIQGYTGEVGLAASPRREQRPKQRMLQVLKGLGENRSACLLRWQGGTHQQRPWHQEIPQRWQGPGLPWEGSVSGGQRQEDLEEPD